MESPVQKDAMYLSQVKALADETRLHILAILASGQLCACDILATLELSQPTLSYHMKLLAECDLVRSRREGKWMYYSLHAQGYHELLAYLEQLSVPGNRPVIKLGPGCDHTGRSNACRQLPTERKDVDGQQ